MMNIKRLKSIHHVEVEKIEKVPHLGLPCAISYAGVRPTTRPPIGSVRVNKTQECTS